MSPEVGLGSLLLSRGTDYHELVLRQPNEGAIVLVATPFVLHTSVNNMANRDINVIRTKLLKENHNFII